MIGAAALSVALLAGCGDDGSAVVDGGADSDASPLVWDDVSDTFRANCIDCHTWSGSYDGVLGKIETSDLIGRIESSHKIGGAERALLLDWLYAGYQEL